MKILGSWRKSLLIYRSIRYRRGYGVHSPFVYNLITKVIEEKSAYYSFYDIELLRKQLLFDETPVSYPDRQNRGKRRSRTVADITRKEAIKPSHGALLFRLVNYFKSRRILQVGTNIGLSTLYLTSYSHELRCVALESVPAFSPIAKRLFEKAAHNPIDLREGDYRELIPKAIDDLGGIDFVFFNTLYEQQDSRLLFDECLKRASDETVFVIEGIKTSRKMRDFWKEIQALPEVTVTLDLYALGIVLFNKRLHKRDYIVYF